MTPEAVRSPLTERFLKERGIDYDLKVIPIKDIDLDQSLHNQARISPIDSDLIDRYHQAEINEAVFPAIIAGRNGSPSSKYVIADGNHRVTAKIRAKRPMVWAYTFQYDNDDQFRSVSRTANAILNGRDNSEAERLMHAAAFVERGIDRKTAAVQCGVSPSRLTTYLQAQAVRRRFEALGIGARSYRDLSDGQITDINTLADAAVRKGLDLVRAGVNTRNIARVVREANLSAHTDSQRLQAQIEALATLGKVGTSGAGLLKTKRDTLAMRVVGAINALEEVHNSGRSEEFATELEKIRNLAHA